MIAPQCADGLRTVAIRRADKDNMLAAAMLAEIDGGPPDAISATVADLVAGLREAAPGQMAAIRQMMAPAR